MSLAIKIEYMYRDGANYKSWEKAIIANPEGVPVSLVEKIILSICEQPTGEKWFIPDKIGLPHLSPVLSEFEQGGEYDHPFHEFGAIEETEDEPNWHITVTELISNIEGVSQSQLREIVKQLDHRSGYELRSMTSFLTVDSNHKNEVFYIVWSGEHYFFYGCPFQAVEHYNSGDESESPLYVSNADIEPIEILKAEKFNS